MIDVTMLVTMMMIRSRLSPAASAAGPRRVLHLWMLFAPHEAIGCNRRRRRATQWFSKSYNILQLSNTARDFENLTISRNVKGVQGPSSGVEFLNL